MCVRLSVQLRVQLSAWSHVCLLLTRLSELQCGHSLLISPAAQTQTTNCAAGPSAAGPNKHDETENG